MGWFTKKKKGETTEEELQEVQTQETVAEAEEVETEKEISEVPSETVDTEIPAEIPADEPGEAPAPQKKGLQRHVTAFQIVSTTCSRQAS